MTNDHDTELTVSDIEAARKNRERATVDNHGAAVGVSHPSQQPTDTDHREEAIICMHEDVMLELRRLRNQRDEINARVKVLVGEEARLASMVRIILKARADGCETDPD